MAHFAAIPDPGVSHVMSMASIGSHLIDRGHKVTVFPFSELDNPTSTGNLGVWPLNIESDFAEKRRHWVNSVQVLSPKEYVRLLMQRSKLILDHAPSAIQAARVDALLVDSIDPAGAAVAETLHLPFVTIHNALPLNEEAGIPPDFLPWKYSGSAWAKVRNSVAYRARQLAIRPLNRLLNDYRSQFGLKPYRRPQDSLSPYAQISQLVPEFDYPRKRLPANFHYVGPYRRLEEDKKARNSPSSDSRPLVYACLGTLYGGRRQIWQAIASACVDLPVRLVISLAGCKLNGRLDLPGDPTVLDFAPQLEYLAQARLSILHGGMNGVMETLAAGTPAVVIPVVGDQFGIGARMEYCGAGLSVPDAATNPSRLRNAIQQILGREGFRQNAERIQTSIHRSGGAKLGADIATEVLLTRRPVLRSV